MKKVLIILVVLLLSACGKQETQYGLDQTNAKKDSGSTIQSVLKDFSTEIVLTDQFKNTNYESEKTYYRSLFLTHISSRVNQDELINYDVHDAIFKDAASDMDKVVGLLQNLYISNTMVENTPFYKNGNLITLFVNDNYLHLEVVNSSNDVYTIYRLGYNELGEFMFDVLEGTRDLDQYITGNKIRYLYYAENHHYASRQVVYYRDNQIYDEMNYSFDSDLQTTFHVETRPSKGVYNVERSEAHFQDGYYVKYYKSNDSEQTYLKLFYNNHGSLNIHHNVSQQDNQSEYAIQWNMLDIGNWDYYQNSAIYWHVIKQSDALLFDADHSGQFGPEMLIEKTFNQPYTEQDIAHPLGVYDYTILNLSDVDVATNRLDAIKAMTDVSQNDYVYLGDTHLFDEYFTMYFNSYVDDSRMQQMFDFIERTL